MAQLLTSRHPSVRSGPLAHDTDNTPFFLFKRAAFNRTLYFEHSIQLDDATSSLATLHMAASSGTTYIFALTGDRSTNGKHP
jgi:hypothetical protein